MSENRIIGFVGFIKRSDHADHCHLPDFEIDDRELMQRAASLSIVERQVAELVVDGHMNKRMANLLSVAVRTIETRRARVMSKMRAKSLPQLVQMWLRVRQIEAEARISGESD
jgi:two-component system response regulator FixJ